MNEIILKMPKRRNKVRVIKSKEDLKEYIEKKKRKELEEQYKEEIEKQRLMELEEEEGKALNDDDDNLDDMDADDYTSKNKKEIFIEKYSISGGGKPLEISMDKVKEDTLSLDEVMIEVQDSYDKGFNDGKEAANIAYQAEIEKFAGWIRNIDILAGELEYRFSKELENFSDALVKTTLVTARKILEREISQDGYIIISQVKKALRNLDENDIVIKITINPEDYEILEKAKSDLIKEDAKLKKTKLSVNPKIEKGGCVLTTSVGDIDSRISTQLQRAGDVLRSTIDETKG